MGRVNKLNQIDLHYHDFICSRTLIPNQGYTHPRRLPKTSILSSVEIQSGSDTNQDRFLIRNSKQPNDGTPDLEPASKKKNCYESCSVKVCWYLSEYLGLGFSVTKSDPVNAQRVLCGQVLANKKSILWDWCLSACSDRAAGLTRKNNGLMAWIRKKKSNLKWLHCNHIISAQDPQQGYKSDQLHQSQTPEFKTFWLEVKVEYKELSDIAISVLLPFGFTYLCKVSFSAMSLIKTKHRNRLSVQNDCLIAVSDIKPRFDSILAKRQPQVSN
ncbi:hypothetical protein QYM36_000205 [Artemia franciscana]|uniref:Uncharacterized protein n=1 Tax=Artemia franciscana TaxID=6661 RepID=A0AA88LCR4_ARTSF|nr:hypothetical protein QYM36_000205 [Artemia franciscana]